MQTEAASGQTTRSPWYRYGVPAAIFIPFAFGLLIFRAQQVWGSGYAKSVPLFAVAPWFFFVPLTLLGALLMHRAELRRRRCEVDLLITSQRFSSVVASAMDAIIMLDERQRVIVFNRAAETMFGCPAREVLGKPLDRFIPEEFRKAHPGHISKFAEAGQTTRTMTAPGILQAQRANGEQFPIEATVSRAETAGQKIFTVILRDVAERVRAEESLRQSEARFRSIYEQAAVGIEQIAPDGELLMVNAALCRMLGYEESELLGKNLEEITHPEDHVRHLALFDAAKSGQLSSYQMEKRYCNRDGSIVWVHVTSSLVNDSAGVPLYRICVVQNLTERKRAEEQLRQAQKMEAIGRLAGGVAHDFNTLLNVMLGYSELLMDELPAEDPRRDKVLQIKNSADTGALLTKQLLAFSRKQAIRQEVLDLRDIVSKMTSMLGRLLRPDIELSVKCSEDVCPAKVDPGQIQQLVLNLAANAGDAMPDGGRLEIEVKPVELDDNYVRRHPSVSVGQYVMLAISDSGMGMDAETVSHIFEPFFTTKGPGSGTGLGLATVYGIAKRNGGDVWVYSEPEVGTIFKVFLPLSQEPMKLRTLISAEPLDVAGSGETILLVDDSAALRELTSVILSRNGYNVLQAEDGVSALELSNGFEGAIHMVLSDIIMPRMRGPNLVEHLRKQRPEIAVAFLSGYTETSISDLDGIDGFKLVEKPYTADSLLQSVRSALDNRS